ncbi:hypothetical protein NP493_1346g00010 [Ridgeia piscesae]|uniref:Uncharacterized protein n=1 Tax=Ridgeia piscesae TaxID=27915 RepID=A0AAD9NEQ1_RIDPI|nr:hypothetical protein NP493_1346g00010 [Ridgeia piscesae]
MAAAYGKTRSKGKAKSLKIEAEPESAEASGSEGDTKRQLRRPIPFPLPASGEPIHHVSVPESSELSSPLTVPNLNSGGIEPSINDLTDALQMTDIGSTEVEDLLEQALDLNRRLKAELANRIALGESTPEFPTDLKLDGQHSFACGESRGRVPVLPPLAQHNKVGAGSVDRRHKQPQDHRPLPTSHKNNKA